MVSGLAGQLGRESAYRREGLGPGVADHIRPRRVGGTGSPRRRTEQTGGTGPCVRSLVATDERPGNGRFGGSDLGLQGDRKDDETLPLGRPIFFRGAASGLVRRGAMAGGGPLAGGGAGGHHARVVIGDGQRPPAPMAPRRRGLDRPRLVALALAQRRWAARGWRQPGGCPAAGLETDAGRRVGDRLTPQAVGAAPHPPRLKSVPCSGDAIVAGENVPVLPACRVSGGQPARRAIRLVGS